MIHYKLCFCAALESDLLVLYSPPPPPLLPPPTPYLSSIHPPHSPEEKLRKKKQKKNKKTNKPNPLECVSIFAVVVGNVDVSVLLPILL